MFTPGYFEVDDPATVRAFVREHAFGTLIVGFDDNLDVNRIPFDLMDTPAPDGRLQGHVARINPLVERLGNGEARAVAVFDGPHGYISPAWYPSTKRHGRTVPTWNYTTVHLHGRVRLVDDAVFITALLERLAARFETGQQDPWTLARAPGTYIAPMVAAIVGVELAIERVECQFKLSQNARPEDFAGAVAGLRASGQHALADLMLGAAPAA